ncbi:MAG TPA: hypothetical protein VMT85_06440 [Thermoanaerobaculia bacterium]|nr:hypothetical protein [Thermoanaerobaculia bacterium]
MTVDRGLRLAVRGMRRARSERTGDVGVFSAAQARLACDTLLGFVTRSLGSDRVYRIARLVARFVLGRLAEPLSTRQP